MNVLSPVGIRVELITHHDDPRGGSSDAARQQVVQHDGRRLSFQRIQCVLVRGEVDTECLRAVVIIKISFHKIKSISNDDESGE